MYILYLDDKPEDKDRLQHFRELTNNKSVEIKVAKTSYEAWKMIENEFPTMISFDHDLGDLSKKEKDKLRKLYEDLSPYGVSEDFEKSEIDEAVNLINLIIFKDLKLENKFIPKNFRYHIHSINSVGYENIDRKLGKYLGMIGLNSEKLEDEDLEHFTKKLLEKMMGMKLR